MSGHMHPLGMLDVVERADRGYLLVGEMLSVVSLDSQFPKLRQLTQLDVNFESDR